MHAAKSRNFLVSLRGPAGVRVLSTKLDVQSNVYQYLERSLLPTNRFQESLTRLPIPLLERTCDRYLFGIRPLLTHEEFENTSKLINEFKEGEGKELQEALLEHDKNNKHTSYLSKPWSDMYLSSRVPIVVNYNPFMMFTPDPKNEFNDQLTRATNLCISVGRFKRSLDEQVLNPEVFYMNPKTKNSPWFLTIAKAMPDNLAIYGAYAFKAFPLDMSQHPSLFNSTRIPQKGMDAIVRNSSMKHVLVMRKGHMFAVDLFDKNGQLVAPLELKSRLGAILNMDLQQAENPLGVLTSLGRDEWADIRGDLVKSCEANKKAVELIDGAVFCLALDDVSTTDPNRLIRSMLHGDDGSNRWFDKSFTINVHSDGLAAINFEHAWGDGVAVLRLMEDIQKDSCNNHWVSPDHNITPYVEDSVNKIGEGRFDGLEIEMNDKLKGDIGNAKSEMNNLVDSLDFSTLEYFKMNRVYIKKQKISPDALMQLAIQLAYNKMNNEMVATYESCSTAIFKHGRTETMRPATSDMKTCVQGLLTHHATPPQQLRQLMNTMSNTHFRLVKEASMGQGFDRHLLGLRITAERLGRPLPAILCNPVFDKVNNFILSTSTLSTDTVALGGFGPVVKNGYGIGYNVAKHRLGYTLSTYKQHRSAKQMTDALKQSLDQIYDVLNQTSPA